MALAEGLVASTRLGTEGTPAHETFDRSWALRTSPALYEEVMNGSMFYASVAVAGVDHAASLTTTAPFALRNPVGSSVDLVVHAVTMGYVSGTLGAGFLAAGQYLESATNATPTGTAVVATGGLKLGLGAPQGKPLETVTLTAGATLIFPLRDISPKLATSAITAQDGITVLPVPIVVPPGASLVLSGVCGAAGTSPRVTLGAIWREVRRQS
jgi:hypothetical protein